MKLPRLLPRSLSSVRRTSQALFLLIFLFLFLQTESQGEDTLGYPAKIFLDFDPLIAISSFLSSRSLETGLLLSLILIGITAVLGRVFCGWVCPLGTLHTIVSTLKNRKRGPVPARLRTFKYYLLLFLLTTSLFTMQITGWFDPLALLVRSLSVSIYPAFNYVIRSFFDTIYALHPPLITSATEFIYARLQDSVLSFQQTSFNQGMLIGLLFLGILLLNFVEKRFWCKYLCPLGALLGLCSRFSVLRRSVSEGCHDCTRCADMCQGGAIETGNTWGVADCLYCLDCDDVCPNHAVRFGFSSTKEKGPLDLGKRKVIASLAAGIFAVPFLKVGSLSEVHSRNARLIRPPGALDERMFLKKCIRCGECMKVCITNGLQPTILEAGLEGIWSPVLIPTLGYCEYNCTLCGQVCPTGAIQNLSREHKQGVKIGMAVIDRSRCLPHSFAMPCLVCEEVCPVPKKAIWLKSAIVDDRAGNTVLLKQPYVDLTQCTGCGICEAKCPVVSAPAIYVISTGESRSQDNQLLLG